jgi:malate dehydrogenase (oxaloacetate-decarboxylating)(NADP+)
VLQLGSSVREIVNMVTIAVVDVQSKQDAQEPDMPVRRRGLFARKPKPAVK